MRIWLAARPNTSSRAAAPDHARRPLVTSGCDAPPRSRLGPAPCTGQLVARGRADPLSRGPLRTTRRGSHRAVPLTATDVRSAVHELLERNPPRAEDGPRCSSTTASGAARARRASSSSARSSAGSHWATRSGRPPTSGPGPGIPCAASPPSSPGPGRASWAAARGRARSPPPPVTPRLLRVPAARITAAPRSPPGLHPPARDGVRDASPAGLSRVSRLRPMAPETAFGGVFPQVIGVTLWSVTPRVTVPVTLVRDTPRSSP